MNRLWKSTKQAAGDFIADDALTQAGAVAFYSALSLAPLLLLFLVATSWLTVDGRANVMSVITPIVGNDAAGAIDTVLEKADTPSIASVAGIIGFLTLLWSASGVFAQLQFALNTIWDVRANPGNGLVNWLRKRLLSVGMIFVILLLLLMSLVASSALLVVSESAEGALPMTEGAMGWFTQVASNVIQAVLFVLLFAMMFRFLPDVKIAWKDVFIGATFTAVLFVIGKFAISFYFSTAGTGSAYGAAGSLIALLLWVYYSALILFFGAEMTQAWVQSGGRSIEPDEHAERVGDKAMSEDEQETVDENGRPHLDERPPINVIRPSRPAIGWQPVLAGVLGVGVVMTILRKLRP